MSCFFRKLTHEEIFELALIDVMWEVANKKLMAVWVADNSPAVHVTRFSISSATCRAELNAGRKKDQTKLNAYNM